MVLCLADLQRVKEAIIEYTDTVNPNSGIEVTIHNSPRKTFVAGTPTNLQAVEKMLNKFRDWIKSKKGITSLATNMQDAYHCKSLSRVKLQFKEILSEFDFQEPSLPVYRNVDGMLYSKENIVQGLTDHFDHPVLFCESILNELHNFSSDNSSTTFFDIGSKGYLTKCVDDIEAVLKMSFNKRQFDS